MIRETINDILNYEIDDVSDHKIVIKFIDTLEAKIQELESIIKGKDVIIESMAQAKGCDGCKYEEYNYDHKCEYCDRMHRKDHYQPKENQDVK